MSTRTFTLATVHGDTDRKAAEDRHADAQAVAGVPREARTAAPCDVQAVYLDEAGGRIEIYVTDWAEAEALAATADVTF